MRLELTGRHMTITPALRRLVTDRLEKLDRLLHDRAVSLQVVLDEEKYGHRAEMTLHARGDHFFHATGIGRDWDTALKQALTKVNQQARKLKGKWDDSRRRGAGTVRTTAGLKVPRARRTAAAEPAFLQEVRVIRARRYDVKPMSVDDAAKELTGGEALFLVFRDERTDTISVLFRRPDGHLGLIEPDA